MAKQVQEKAGLIAQAEAEYEAIVEEVKDCCQKAQKLRRQADELRRSGNTDSKVATQIRQLLEQAEYYDQLANQKDGHPRLEALRCINDLQREASSVKAAISHNEGVLARLRQELIEAREEAAALIRRAEERVQETEQLLASQLAKLEELEGK